MGSLDVFDANMQTLQEGDRVRPWGDPDRRGLVVGIDLRRLSCGVVWANPEESEEILGLRREDDSVVFEDLVAF